MALNSIDPFLHLPSSPHRRPHFRRSLPSLRVSASTPHPQNPRFQALPERSSPSLQTKRREALGFDPLEMGDGLFEAIEELERMARDPSDVLGGMADHLSPRELQLVLVYFAQEGRDSYCALEVFDWLRKEDRVDGETMELMASIACGWIERLISGGNGVGDVVGLLNEMDCVGVETAGFDMLEKVVSLYWERGRRDEAVEFVKDVMRRGGVGRYGIGDGGEEGRGGPTGYLAWKMMEDGNYMGATKLVIEFKESGLQPEVYSYLIAMTALVKEQQEFSKVLRKLRASIKSGLIADLDEENLRLIEQHQSNLLKHGVQLSKWAIQGGSNTVLGLVHERLLALYTCAGYGVEAEQQLWQMKLLGRKPDGEIHDAVLAICASQKEIGAVRRLLAGARTMTKTYSWLLRGYIKGGHYVEASEALTDMLDMGLVPGYLDRVVVLQGLRKSIKESGEIEAYVKLCRRLADMDLIGPCIVYMYVHKYRLWILRTI